MKATIVLDRKAEMELVELSRISNASRSELVRTAVEDLYLKEKRAREGFLFFVDSYRKGIITKDVLLLLLPRKDAEAVIIGVETAKESAKFAASIGL